MPSTSGLYHVNPETGEPGLCKAEQECPFKGETEHYKTLTEATEAAEEIARKKHKLAGLSKATSTTARTESGSTVVHLADLCDVDAMRKLINDGYVSVGPGPDGSGLAVLSYTLKTQYSGMWTPETKMARGLVVKMHGDHKGRLSRDEVAAGLNDATVVARGMSKFFTVHMAQSDWGKTKTMTLVDDDEGVTVGEAPVIDFDAPAYVSDKLDGSLGIGVVTDDGIMVTSRATFDSTEAKLGSRLLKGYDDEKLSKLFHGRLRGTTPLFETIDKNGWHVVEYSTDDVVFLGLMDNKTGRWTPAEAVGDVYGSDVADALIDPDRVGEYSGDYAATETARHSPDGDDARRFAIPAPSKTHTLREALDMVEGDQEKTNDEGVVVTIRKPDGGQDMYKIKYAGFYAANHVKRRGGFALSDVVAGVGAMSVDDLMEGELPDFSDGLTADEAKTVKSTLDGMKNRAASEIVVPARRLADTAVEQFKALSSGLDLSTRTGAAEFAKRMKTTELSDQRLKPVLFALKSAVARDPSLTGDDGSLLKTAMKSALTAVSKQLLRNSPK